MSITSTKIRISFGRNGTYAVIMREGPSKWTRMLKWDTSNDKLTEGQWINSKIPNFSINSDASLVLSFVQSYKKKHDYGTWVALSKPPWFTALAVWHVGDSWGGQCRFITDRKIHIGQGLNELKFEGKLKKNMEWISKDPNQNFRYKDDWPTKVTEQNWVAIKKSEISQFEIRVSTSQPRYSAYQYIQSRGYSLDLPEDIFDMDLDGQGRIIYTRRNGVIYRITRKNEVIEHETVFDLSQMTPAPIEAPASMAQW